MNANDKQVAGQHYQATMQHWDYAILALDNRYLEGNITKYVTRHRKKNGLQDIEKAVHYMEKLLEQYRAGNVIPPAGDDEYDVHGFCVANALNTYESFIIKRLCGWNSIADLDKVLTNINILKLQAIQAQRTDDAVKCGYDDRDLNKEAGAAPGPNYVNQD